MWRSVGTVVGLAGVVGWSAGCVGRPDTGSQAVAWADPALADSATPHVFPPDDILIYPKPDDPFALAERIAYGSASLTKLPPDYLYPRLKDAVWYHQRKQIAMPQPPKWELGEAFHRLYFKVVCEAMGTPLSTVARLFKAPKWHVIASGRPV